MVFWYQNILFSTEAHEMSNVLKISEAASLALHAMSYLAVKNGAGPMSTKEIAGHFKVSEAHLSKVLQRLAKQGLVKTARGPGGGAALARKPDDITMLEIFEAIEGPIDITPCLLGKPACGYPRCILGDLVGRVNDTVENSFAGTTLADLAKEMGGKKNAKKKKNN